MSTLYPTQRLFLAIPLPKPMQAQLHRFVDTLHLPNYRIVEAANLHITVRFLGNVKEAAIPALVSTYQPIVNQCPPFSLQFSSLTYAPPQNPGSMIWAIFEQHEVYQQLVKETKNVIDRFFQEHHYHIVNDTKDCIPHVTVARREGNNRILNLQSLDQPTIEDLDVSTVELVQSQLSPQGSVYTTLQTFSLNEF